MRTSAPLSSSTTSRGSIPEYQPTRGPRPARCFGSRAARIATSTRSRFARRKAAGERARVDDGVKVDNGAKVDNRAKVDQVDSGGKADSSNRWGWERIVCFKPLLFRTTGESIWIHPSLPLKLLLQHPRSISA